MGKPGRPKGKKDSYLRITKKRAAQRLSDLKHEGITTGAVAAENLDLIDYMIRTAARDAEKADELYNEAQATMHAKEFMSYVKQMNIARDQLNKAIAQRQAWLKEINKYSEYTKGTERVVTDEQGTVTTVGDLLEGKTLGPLIEG